MPAKSKDQQRAAGIALSVMEGRAPVSKLKGASLSMYRSMTESELRHFARGPKAKKGKR